MKVKIDNYSLLELFQLRRYVELEIEYYKKANSGDDKIASHCLNRIVSLQTLSAQIRNKIYSIII